MKRIAKWIYSLPKTARLLGGSFISSIIFYGAAVLSYSLREAMQLTPKYALMIHSIFYVFTYGIIILTYSIFKTYYDEIVLSRERAQSNLLHAYTVCDRVLIEELRTLNIHDMSNYLRNTIHTALDQIQRLIESAYNLFESECGKMSTTGDRIDFEVTFMTESYRDGKITIPASANKDGRSPRSMVLRRTQADIYNNTETAKMYKSQRPGIIIVDDTTIQSYTEIYPDQKRRIKSSIIYPVLSNTNELLGTFVVHCDKRHFFAMQDQKHWSDLLEVFAKRIALEKMKIDKAVEMNGKSNVQIEIDVPF